MTLAFLTICLIIVLLTLENLIVTGFHTYSHRLLPLVLGLLALYDFYLIVEYLTGDRAVFSVLKELLLIQLLDVIIYYIVDFMKMKMNMIYNFVLVSILILVDIMIFTQIHNPDMYKSHVRMVAGISAIGIVVMTIVTSHKRVYSRQTMKNNQLMLIALCVPAFCLVLCMLGYLKESVFMPLAIDVTCIIVDYLFVTDRLREVDSILKEEHFQTLDIPAFLFDKDMFFLAASNKARALFADRIEEIEKNPALFELQSILRELVEKGGVDYRIIGNQYYKMVLQDAYYKGKMKGYILTFMDVTEQKNETDFAKEIAKQKSEFLANMSHDLRSPLHAIIGSSEIALSRVEMSERARVLINNIHNAGHTLLDIVNSILDFSKLESNKLELHCRKYSFKRLIEEQAQLGYSLLKTKPVKFSVQVVDNYPEFLYGDVMRVRQIMQNIIGNAVKFTDHGEINFKMRVFIENDFRVRIDLSVTDTGIGMTKEQQEMVFQDYVTYAQEQKKEGTGLGLTIVRRLAEMMDGNARAVSDGVSGSTIMVSFYQELVKDDLTELRQEGMKLEPPLRIDDETQIDGGGIWINSEHPSYIYPEAKVLIADDMAVNCQIFEQLVAPWKVSVDVAKDGKEAWELCKEKQYDMIFLDQMMPIMSGTEAADEIRKFTDTPMVLVTANITETMREESRHHGFDAFMQKPIEFPVLKRTLEKYLPENLQREYVPEAVGYQTVDIRNAQMYEKMLTTYVSELKELYSVLPEYKKNNVELFRNKVHGIKGVSRQLGKENIALLSEIMEMAAITDNRPFIDKYFDTFYSDLQFVIQTSEKELARIIEMREMDEPDEQRELVEVSTEEMMEAFDVLAAAFEDYDMDAIEDQIAVIDGMKLEEELERKYRKIKEFCDDMEYEAGLEIVRQVNENLQVSVE